MFDHLLNYITLKCCKPTQNRNIFLKIVFSFQEILEMFAVRKAALFVYKSPKLLNYLLLLLLKTKHQFKFLVLFITWPQQTSCLNDI